MKTIGTFFMVTLCIGVPCCSRAPGLTETASNGTVTDAFGSAAARITNRFGMTFCLVTVDPKDPKHEETFPRQSYYLQQTELSGAHFAAYEKLAAGSEFDPADGLDIWRFPSEWREVSNLAIALSRVDPDYDYRLPTREEWRFACMSGYEQRCEENRPNSYGIVGMLDGDVEVIDELSAMKGHEYGVLMGRWINNWGEHTGKPEPDCPCKHWTLCNPDADDSLNEIIVGRFILLPEGTVRTTDNSGG
jgi:hypothetical protein